MSWFTPWYQGQKEVWVIEWKTVACLSQFQVWQIYTGNTVGISCVIPPSHFSISFVCPLYLDSLNFSLLFTNKRRAELIKMWTRLFWGTFSYYYHVFRASRWCLNAFSIYFSSPLGFSLGLHKGRPVLLAKDVRAAWHEYLQGAIYIQLSHLTLQIFKDKTEK